MDDGVEDRPVGGTETEIVDAEEGERPIDNVTRNAIFFELREVTAAFQQIVGGARRGAAAHGNTLEEGSFTRHPEEAG